MRADMISLDREGISYADADHLADLWNKAYPLMRHIVTGRVDRYRGAIDREEWIIDPASPTAEWRRMRTPSEAQYRHRLKCAEELRRDLGQLDRGTHKPCTQSPGCFSVSSANSRVRGVLSSLPANAEGLALVYQLAAMLSEVDDRRARRLRERTD